MCLHKKVTRFSRHQINLLTFLLAITVMFNQSAYIVDENGGSAQLTLILSNPSSVAVTILVATTDGLASGE